MLGPTGSNPAGIYYRNGALQIDKNVKINGSLVVVNGAIEVIGAGSVITAASGFPALVLKNDLNVKSPGTGPCLTVNGVSYLTGSIKSTGSSGGSQVNFVGSVLFAGGSVNSSYSGTVNITFDPSKTYVPGLDKTAGPLGVKFVSWTQ